jgi:hypothetical protein
MLPTPIVSVTPSMKVHRVQEGHPAVSGIERRGADRRGA